MRILLLMDPFLPVPPTHYGGIERVIYDIACQFKQAGHQVTIVAGPNSKSPDRLITYGNNGELNPKVNFGTFKTVFMILHKEIKRHDVVHNFGRLLFLLPFLKHKIAKVQTYMRYVNRKNINLFDKFNPRNLVYTAVSKAIAGTGTTTKSKWEVIYNCAPLKNFKFQGNTSPDAYLVFLGRLEKCKGAHTAIEVAKMTGKKLIIAGNISSIPRERAYYQEELVPLFDGTQIEYIGEVNNEQKNLLLGGAAALLTPVEWFEPFPIIIPEAYACGTPVLGFDNGGISEGIIAGQTGFVSTTVEEMASHVLRLNELSRYVCRHKAEQEYSDVKVSQNYLHVYNNLINL